MVDTTAHTRVFVIASDGVALDLDSLAKAYSYSGGDLQYQEVTFGGKTYRQTFSYTGSDVTGVSGWVEQG